MEIKIGDRIYQVADDCPIDSPKRGILVRHLREHGPESLLASKKTAPFASCIWDKLAEAGAELVERFEEAPTTEGADFDQKPGDSRAEGQDQPTGDPVNI